jgi:hypothetical protein
MKKKEKKMKKLKILTYFGILMEFFMKMIHKNLSLLRLEVKVHLQILKLIHLQIHNL